MRNYKRLCRQLALALAFSTGAAGFVPSSFAMETQASREIAAAEAKSSNTVYLTLEEALAMAEKNNRDIHLAEYARDLARWQRSEIRRTHGLKVTLEGRGGRIDGKAYDSARIMGRSITMIIPARQRRPSRYLPEASWKIPSRRRTITTMPPI